MKRFLPVILVPYVCALDLTLLLSSGCLSEAAKPVSILLVLLFLAANGAEVFFVFRCMLLSFKEIFCGNDGSASVKKIINIKLVQIPAYIYIFIFGFGFLFVPLGFIFTILCFVADSFSILLTGLLMTFSLVKTWSEKKCSTAFLIFHAVLSFIFCLDILDGIYLKTRKSEEFRRS